MTSIFVHRRDKKSERNKGAKSGLERSRSIKKKSVGKILTLQFETRLYAKFRMPEITFFANFCLQHSISEPSGFAEYLLS